MSYANQPWQNLPTGGHGHMICMGNLGGVFSQENTPEGHTETQNSSFFSYKQVSGRNGDCELIMTNAFILCDLFGTFRKVMQRTEKVALNQTSISVNTVWM